MPDPHDLTLLGLTDRASKFIGHIEDMDGEERAWLIGAFAGAVRGVLDRVFDLYQHAGHAEELRQVALALGVDENWPEGVGWGCGGNDSAYTVHYRRRDGSYGSASIMVGNPWCAPADCVAIIGVELPPGGGGGLRG